ncbi:phage tail tape measure protein [Kribbella sp. NPDC056861]|uniref:phage tail tape measure protein n=1 Tax=Kribbella sp. NPDC056861 TaxID=3154857 RepID=UPI003434DD06
MGDRTVSVKLTLRNEGFVAGLRQASSQAKDFTNSVQQGAQKNKGSLDTMARSFAGVGLAAGAVGVLAVKHFADFDQAMSKVRASTHETAGNMQALRDAALDAGAKTTFSATQAATAIENLAKAGVSTKDILGGGLKGALDLAAAGSLQVGDAAEIAATAMTQFGLAGKDVPHIADLLAAAAGKAQGEVSDMAMALKQGGLVAAQMGLSIEETTGTLAAFASAGLIGSDAGTSLKTMLLALANPSGKAAQTLEDLGIAAYDATGNFVGLAPLAEQLKTKLGGLSQQQRDAALATIFGSDAIRAASVLYKNGAGGIADWTAKVNDQGYAAETAALKTDNLKGDLERLGGAFDTALIKLGEGANGPLRSLVQSADDAVSALADLPSWVQQGALALTGLLAAGGLGAAGLIKGVQAASDLRGALQKLDGVSKGLKFGLGGLGLALTTAAVVFGAFAKQSADSKRKVQEFQDTLDQTTGAITGNTRAYVSNELAQKGLSEKAKSFGLSLSSVTDAALGNQSALDSIVGTLTKVADANVIAGSGAKSGVSRFNEQGEAANALIKELTGMNGSLTEAQKLQKYAAEGATENKSAQELQAEAVKKANEAFQAQAQSLQDVITKMHAASGAALDLAGSQIAVEAAIDKASEAIKENGKTHDITNEKGRANKTALLDIADAANKQTDAMLKAGKGNATVAATATTVQASFVKLATQMGYTVPQAKAMAKSLIDIPNVTREAKLKANKADLDAKLAAAQKALANPKLEETKKATLQARIDQLLAAQRQAQAAIDSLHGKTVNVNLNTTKTTTERTIRTQTTTGGGHAVGHAAGGQIGGYSPSSTADNIPIMATAGEYMQQVAAVDYYGVDVMNALNNRRIPKSALKGYRYGGAIGLATGGGVPSGRLVDPAYILRQLNIPFNPLAGINYSGALSAVNKANASANAARETATRADANEQAAKLKVAQIQRAITLQQRYVAQLRAQGASEATIRREQRDTIRLQDQLYVAKGKVTAATKASNNADAVYRIRAEAAAKAAQLHKEAIAQLVEQQKAAVEMAGQIAESLKGQADIADLFKTSMTGSGLLAGLQQQGAQLAKFRTLLDALRKAKLSEDLISQIIGKGSAQGSAIAQGILAGGAGLVAALNKAQANLDAQANQIGAGAANAQYGVKLSGKRAGGGYVGANSSYLVGEHHPEILTMGSQPGWITPNPGTFMGSSASGIGGSVVMKLDARDLRAIAAAVSRVDVSVNEGRLTGLIDARAKTLDDRQALEYATGRR